MPFADGLNLSALPREARFTGPCKGRRKARVLRLWEEVKQGRITGLAKAMVENDYKRQFMAFNRKQKCS